MTMPTLEDEAIQSNSPVLLDQDDENGTCKKDSMSHMLGQLQEQGVGQSIAYSMAIELQKYKEDKMVEAVNK